MSCPEAAFSVSRGLGGVTRGEVGGVSGAECPLLLASMTVAAKQTSRDRQRGGHHKPTISCGGSIRQQRNADLPDLRLPQGLAQDGPSPLRSDRKRSLA